MTPKLTIEQYNTAADKVKKIADDLSQDEQKILYLYLYRQGHRVHDSQMFVADILRKL